MTIMRPASLLFLPLRLCIAVLLALNLTGCIAGLAGVAASGAGLVNLAHKTGTMTVEMEGSGDLIEAFKSASISAGGTVPQSNSQFARAEFSDTDVMVEAQQTSRTQLRLRGSSLSDVGRTWEFEDGITITTQKVVDTLKERGFSVIKSERDRGV